MTHAGRHEDPVEDYVLTLTAALRGPVRAKARIIDEIRDGLTDAVAARSASGLSYEDAARREVQTFGTPAQIAPPCQQELTLHQVRRTRMGRCPRHPDLDRLLAPDLGR